MSGSVLDVLCTPHLVHHKSYPIDIYLPHFTDEKKWGPRLLSTLSWIICSQMSWFASYSIYSLRHLTVSSCPFFSHHTHSLFYHAWRLPCPLVSMLYLPDWALSSCIWGCSFRHLCNLHEAGSTCLTMNKKLCNGKFWVLTESILKSIYSVIIGLSEVMSI